MLIHKTFETLERFYNPVEKRKNRGHTSSRIPNPRLRPSTSSYYDNSLLIDKCITWPNMTFCFEGRK